MQFGATISFVHWLTEVSWKYCDGRSQLHRFFQRTRDRDRFAVLLGSFSFREREGGVLSFPAVEKWHAVFRFTILGFAINENVKEAVKRKSILSENAKRVSENKSKAARALIKEHYASLRTRIKSKSMGEFYFNSVDIY